MALYFLDYDLRKAKDYQKLYDELANFKAVRVLKSQSVSGKSPIRQTNLVKPAIFEVEIDRNRPFQTRSQWCFNRSNTDASRLRDYFKQFVDGDNGLTVVEVTEWATYNAEGTPKDLG